ncbi:MAG: putative tRNA/rRNA methyltransferase [Clostridia bacterium]|nr:putative tRNA/rRNA methyltransferase [Clostridia bacterium]
MARAKMGRPTDKTAKKWDDRKGPKQWGSKQEGSKPAGKGPYKATGEAKGPYKGGPTAKGPFKGEGDARTFRKDDRRGPKNRIVDVDPYDNYDKEEDNINLIEGRNPVLEALKSGREIDKIFIQKGANEGSIRQIIAIAREKNLLIKEVDKIKLDNLSLTHNHQGVIASAALYKYYEIEEILDIAKEKGEDPFIIILDEITDNHNLGAIIRTADAAGVHGIIIPKRRSASLTPVVAKTSAGAIEYVPVSKVTNINQTLEYLKKQGLWIVGADMSGETYYQKDMTGPIALVIGSEGEGIGRLIRENCDYLVKIPMSGKISSLNAGVSAGIIAYDIFRQRQLKSLKGGIH